MQLRPGRSAVRGSGVDAACAGPAPAGRPPGGRPAARGERPGRPLPGERPPRPAAPSAPRLSAPPPAVRVSLRLSAPGSARAPARHARRAAPVSPGPRCPAVSFSVSRQPAPPHHRHPKTPGGSAPSPRSPAPAHLSSPQLEAGGELGVPRGRRSSEGAERGAAAVPLGVKKERRLDPGGGGRAERQPRRDSNHHHSGVRSSWIPGPLPARPVAETRHVDPGFPGAPNGAAAGCGVCLRGKLLGRDGVGGTRAQVRRVESTGGAWFA